MSNPFYVEHGNDWGTGLMGLSQSLGQAVKQRDERQLFKNAQTKENYIQSLFKAVQNPENIEEIANLRAEFLRGHGLSDDDMWHTLTAKERSDKDPEAFQKMLMFELRKLAPQRTEQVFGPLDGSSEPPKTREIKKGGEIITQEWNKQTGKWDDVSEAPRFKEEGESSIEEKINILKSVNQDTPDSIIAGVATGSIDIETDPITGQMFLVNKVTGRKQFLKEAEEKVAQDQTKPEKHKKTIDELVPGIGPGSAMKDFINKVIGPIVPGVPFKNTERAKNNLRIMNRTLTPFLRVSKMGAKFDVEDLKKVLPNPDAIFIDPDTLELQINNLKDSINNTIDAKSALIRPDMPKKQRSDLMSDINSLQTALQLLPESKTFNMDVIRAMPISELKKIDLSQYTADDRLQIEDYVDELLMQQGQ